MSQWTQVCGNIRLDAMIMLDDERLTFEAWESNIAKAFGEPISYEEVGVKKSIIPCGSEGSIKYKIVRQSNEASHLAAFTVPIWGSLRDYDSDAEIFKWIKKVSKSKDAINIRQGIIIVETSLSTSIIMYDEEKGWIKKGGEKL